MGSAHHSRANEVLRGFGAVVGLDDCGLDEAGVAQFALDDVFVSMDLDEEDGRLRLLSPIGRPGAGSLGPMLDANLSRGGAVVARDAASGVVVLTLGLPVEGLDVQGFEAALGAFVAKVERLRAVLGEEDTEARGTPPPTVAPWGRDIIVG